MILSFDKPKKLRSTKEHNEMFQSDSGVAGTYVPNMSQEDEQRFKAKHVKGNHERIEIRVSRGANILIKIFKSPMRTKSNDWRDRVDDHEDMQFSTNGKLDITFKDWEDIQTAIQEARWILEGKLSY